MQFANSQSFAFNLKITFTLSAVDSNGGYYAVMGALLNLFGFSLFWIAHLFIVLNSA